MSEILRFANSLIMSAAGSEEASVVNSMKAIESSGVYLSDVVADKLSSQMEITISAEEIQKVTQQMPESPLDVSQSENAAASMAKINPEILASLQDVQLVAKKEASPAKLNNTKSNGRQL